MPIPDRHMDQMDGWTNIMAIARRFILTNVPHAKRVKIQGKEDNLSYTLQPYTYIDIYIKRICIVHESNNLKVLWSASLNKHGRTLHEPHELQNW